MLSLPLPAERGARLLAEARLRAAWDPNQPRDERGRWSPEGSGSGTAADPWGATDKDKWQAMRRQPNTPEEHAQQSLADAQANPLAHPEFVLGMENDIGGETMRYVAAYGEEFKPTPLPDDVKMGTPRECYKNASLLVMMRPDLTYAEGFAKTAKTGHFTFMHAWAVDAAGNVVDPTWSDGISYFGVRYERAAYLKYLYKAKVYGVLGSTHKNAQKAIATGGAGLR